MVPELSLAFDAGMALRSFAGVEHLFLSHAHVDHAGALPALLGIRALVGKGGRLKVFLPKEIAEDLQNILAAWTKLQRYDLCIDPQPLSPGEERPFKNDYVVRGFRTHHPVPSLGYEFVRKTKRLRTEYTGLPGPEIARLRQAGDESMFEIHESSELAYATDTLVEVLDNQPHLLQTRVLILECTFLDEKKALKDARAGCHIHLDELLTRADRVKNSVLVLMHFSQIYKPDEVVAILDRRCPPELRQRIVPFVATEAWPG
jgi:ribonuclease Z